MIEKNKLKPTEVGLWLYSTLLAAVPELVDPGATARMETRLDAVLEGGVPVDTVIAEVVARTGDMVRSILAAAGATALPAVKRPPTPKMLDAARAKAKWEGGRLPKGLADDFDACRAYLGPMREGPQLASEKQAAWIKSLVGRGATPPEGYPDAVTASAARVFLDAAAKSAAAKSAPAKVPA